MPRGAGRGARRRARKAALPQARRARGPLRLGFVSTDFCSHPVGRLIVGLLERLDRSRFTVVVYAVDSAGGRRHLATDRGRRRCVPQHGVRGSGRDRGGDPRRPDRCAVRSQRVHRHADDSRLRAAPRADPGELSRLYRNARHVMLRLDHRRPLLHPGRRASALRRTPRLRRPLLSAVGPPARRST